MDKRSSKSMPPPSVPVYQTSRSSGKPDGKLFPELIGEGKELPTRESVRASRNPPELGVKDEAGTRATQPESLASSIWRDWSGRGQDVEFGPTDTLPLQQGKFLGRGASADVHEVFCQGIPLARKQIYCTRKIKLADVHKEIDVLRRADNKHIIKLVGSYTQGRILGILLWPVAICDLAIFMEEYEEAVAGNWTSGLLPQFCILNGASDPGTSFIALTRRFTGWFGCLASGIDHLHRNGIRHKDIKPRNILLTRQNLYITDFGLAKDFSEASTSITDGIERGTYKYFAPEVARYEPRGRAADIFSLGCVFSEMATVISGRTLTEFDSFRRTNEDASFHRNLDKVLVWTEGRRHWRPHESDHVGFRRPALIAWDSAVVLTKRMLDPDAFCRPSSWQICRELSYPWPSIMCCICQHDFLPADASGPLAQSKSSIDSNGSFVGDVSKTTTPSHSQYPGSSQIGAHDARQRGLSIGVREETLNTGRIAPERRPSFALPQLGPAISEMPISLVGYTLPAIGANSPSNTHSSTEHSLPPLHQHLTSLAEAAEKEVHPSMVSSEQLAPWKQMRKPLSEIFPLKAK